MVRYISVLASAFFITWLNVAEGVNHFSLEERNIARYKRQATCDAKYQFKCDNNVCISHKDVCDGIAQCEDGSDETINHCGHLQCQPSMYKCTYGACININYRCNGVKNCVDNSDEEDCDPTSSTGRDFTLRQTRSAQSLDCGQKSVRPAELIIGAGNAENAEFPWQAAIYLEKVHICGGSIISTKVILSAAHCFETSQWDKYKIGVGKLYRTFEDAKDIYAQYRDVLEVIIQQEFGANLAFDIALVILKQKLIITKFVQLICLDTTLFQESTLDNAEGVSTGFTQGYTNETGDISETLNKIQVKYYKTGDCQARLPPDFKSFYSPYVPDKMCAGVVNSNLTACQSESGGPLAFRNEGDGRFYVRGVASMGSFKTNAACGASKLTLYTSVEFHRNFITNILAKYKEEPQLSGDCILPNRTLNGIWTVVGASNVYSPGDLVISGKILKFDCNSNYKLYPETQGFGLFRTCNNGNWDGEFPICIKTCKSILTNEGMVVDCYYKGRITSCMNPYDGTSAKISCKDLYIDNTLTENPQRICIDGAWDYSLPTCDPDCGHKSIRPTELLIGAKNAEKSEYPWQAAIYLEKVHICGGSIISTKVILSAAHCFETNQWDKYQIGVGKIYRTFGDAKDTSAQYRDVQEVIIQQEFGANLAFDIALVILKKQLQITEFVRPICLDRTLIHETTLANAEGVITGWGYTKETGDASDILNKIQVKYYNTRDCKANLPPDFKSFYTPYVPDKMCAGILNSNLSACQSESGGPLAFRKDAAGRFYVRGVASIARVAFMGSFKTNTACNASKLTLYTSVAFHRDFILKNLAKYKEEPQLSTQKFKYNNIICEDCDCILPNHPVNGFWTILGRGSGGHSVGDLVISTTILQFNCKPNYKLYPEIEGFGLFRTCNNGNWDGLFPICIKTCKSILTDERMLVECYYKGGRTNCNDPYDGSRAIIRCKDLYIDNLLIDNPQRVCTDGSWNNNSPTCDPDCGHKSVRPTKLLIGGKNAVEAEYPWQAAIYLEQVHICGGSIISTKVILSAAHCFETSKHWDKYQIGVGKLYSTFKDANDTDAQYRDVHEVIIPQNFHDGADYAFDIALVILKTQLQITNSVRLICLDKTQFQDSTLAGAEGVITGWGYTKETGTPSKILKKLQVKYYATNDCQATLPPDFKTFYTPYVPDKLCAGVLNSNQSACQSDSGGPLAFRREGADRFYVRGVASVGPFKINAACDSSKLTLYTSVAFHKDFIVKNLELYKEEPQTSPSFERDPPLTTTTTLKTPTSVNLAQPGSSRGCILPSHPMNGKWSLHDKWNITEQSSQKVQESTIIKFECDLGYKFYPEYNERYWYKECRDTKWGFLPECRKTCESRISTERLIITCDLDGSKVNCENPYVGTIAKMECAPFYENPSFKYSSRRKHYCLQSGWDYQLPICEPECGITSIQPQRLVIGGNETKSGDYPWQVAIFLNEEQICGGSIISQRIILTAGHCFDHPNNVERYKVGAGKLYRTYKDARDLHAQYSNVTKIEIGELDPQYRGDIAVIILETPFNLTAFVRPVCFDGEEFNHLQLIDETGIVTGWGYTTETGSSSEVLKELRVNYFTRNNCTNHIRHDFRQYYSYDKICAGVLTKDENVCRGDSGGPLVFRHESRYYIRGIVSISASKPNAQCDTASLAFYTSVSFHRRYIEKYVRLFRT